MSGSLVDRLVGAVLQAENDLIESDARALGITEQTAHEYEIVYQHHEGRDVYRGIRRNGVFVWDRHPDWPAPDGWQA